jgi:DNA-binding MurR/RpiR family transcriptional regulator
VTRVFGKRERVGNQPRKVTDKDVEHVIIKTLESKAKTAPLGSTRGMAEATGMSQSTVSRIWRALGLKPQRTETFKLSDQLRRGQPFGSPVWVAQSAARLSLTATLRPRGWPRKAPRATGQPRLLPMGL